MSDRKSFTSRFSSKSTRTETTETVIRTQRRVIVRATVCTEATLYLRKVFAYLKSLNQQNVNSVEVLIKLEELAKEFSFNSSKKCLNAEESEERLGFRSHLADLQLLHQSLQVTEAKTMKLLSQLRMTCTVIAMNQDISENQSVTRDVEPRQHVPNPSYGELKIIQTVTKQTMNELKDMLKNGDQSVCNHTNTFIEMCRYLGAEALFNLGVDFQFTFVNRWNENCSVLGRNTSSDIFAGPVIAFTMGQTHYKLIMFMCAKCGRLGLWNVSAECRVGSYDLTQMMNFISQTIGTLSFNKKQLKVLCSIYLCLLGAYRSCIFTHVIPKISSCFLSQMSIGLKRFTIENSQAMTNLLKFYEMAMCMLLMRKHSSVYDDWRSLLVYLDMVHRWANDVSMISYDSLVTDKLADVETIVHKEKNCYEIKFIFEDGTSKSLFVGKFSWYNRISMQFEDEINISVAVGTLDSISYLLSDQQLQKKISFRKFYNLILSYFVMVFVIWRLTRGVYMGGLKQILNSLLDIFSIKFAFPFTSPTREDIRLFLEETIKTLFEDYLQKNATEWECMVTVIEFIKNHFVTWYVTLIQQNRMQFDLSGVDLEDGLSSIEALLGKSFETRIKTFMSEELGEEYEMSDELKALEAEADLDEEDLDDLIKTNDEAESRFEDKMRDLKEKDEERRRNHKRLITELEEENRKMTDVIEDLKLKIKQQEKIKTEAMTLLNEKNEELQKYTHGLMQTKIMKKELNDLVLREQQRRAYLEERKTVLYKRIDECKEKKQLHEQVTKEVEELRKLIEEKTVENSDVESDTELIELQMKLMTQSSLLVETAELEINLKNLEIETKRTDEEIETVDANISDSHDKLEKITDEYMQEMEKVSISIKKIEADIRGSEKLIIKQTEIIRKRDEALAKLEEKRRELTITLTDLTEKNEICKRKLNEKLAELIAQRACVCGESLTHSSEQILTVIRQLGEYSLKMSYKHIVKGTLGIMNLIIKLEAKGNNNTTVFLYKTNDEANQLEYTFEELTELFAHFSKYISTNKTLGNSFKNMIARLLVLIAYYVYRKGKRVDFSILREYQSDQLVVSLIKILEAIWTTDVGSSDLHPLTKALQALEKDENLKRVHTHCTLQNCAVESLSRPNQKSFYDDFKANKYMLLLVIKNNEVSSEGIQIMMSSQGLLLAVEKGDLVSFDRLIQIFGNSSLENSFILTAILRQWIPLDTRTEAVFADFKALLKASIYSEDSDMHKIEKFLAKLEKFLDAKSDTSIKAHEFLLLRAVLSSGEIHESSRRAIPESTSLRQICQLEFEINCVKLTIVDKQLLEKLTVELDTGLTSEKVRLNGKTLDLKGADLALFVSIIESQIEQMSAYTSITESLNSMRNILFLMYVLVKQDTTLNEFKKLVNLLSERVRFVRDSQRYPNQVVNMVITGINILGFLNIKHLIYQRGKCHDLLSLFTSHSIFLVDYYNELVQAWSQTLSDPKEVVDDLVLMQKQQFQNTIEFRLSINDREVDFKYNIKDRSFSPQVANSEMKMLAYLISNNIKSGLNSNCVFKFYSKLLVLATLLHKHDKTAEAILQDLMQHIRTRSGFLTSSTLRQKYRFVVEVARILFDKLCGDEQKFMLLRLSFYSALLPYLPKQTDVARYAGYTLELEDKKVTMYFSFNDFLISVSVGGTISNSVKCSRLVHKLENGKYSCQLEDDEYFKPGTQERIAQSFESVDKETVEDWCRVALMLHAVKYHERKEAKVSDAEAKCLRTILQYLQMKKGNIQLIRQLGDKFADQSVKFSDALTELLNLLSQDDIWIEEEQIVIGSALVIETEED